MTRLACKSRRRIRDTLRASPWFTHVRLTVAFLHTGPGLVQYKHSTQLGAETRVAPRGACRASWNEWAAKRTK